MPQVESSKNTRQRASHPLTDHFRCPDDLADISVDEALSVDSGYFNLGPDVICYGQCASGTPAESVTDPLHDALHHVRTHDASLQLPFDPAQVLDNLRHERFLSGAKLGKTANKANGFVRQLYYLARPLMSVDMRKHLQRIYLRDWEQIPFPRWPVDSTVENTLEQLLILSMKCRNQTRVPFIWFWPDAALSCATVTHDVEAAAGWDFCSQLMDMDDSFGIKSAFQVVPEDRYPISQERLNAIRDRGFELNVHDLNHDGNLLTDHDEFLRRAEKINSHAKTFGALGFRSAVLYRNIDWYDALDFSYDLSVPNVAHLDPQRGGCCTVFPFFNGKMLELPVTMAQDYSIFNILKDLSTRLWKQQISLIRQKHGLMQMIVHPDYILGTAERRVYAELLAYLSELRANEQTWIALPAEVAAWWRLRNDLRLVNEAGTWKVHGEGRERARIAYASVANGKLVYEFEPAAVGGNTQQDRHSRWSEVRRG